MLHSDTFEVCVEPNSVGEHTVYFGAAGGAGEKLLMPGTGFLTVGAASSLAFCQVLREEYPEVACKLNQVLFLNAGMKPVSNMKTEIQQSNWSETGRLSSTSSACSNYTAFNITRGLLNDF